MRSLAFIVVCILALGGGIYSCAGFTKIDPGHVGVLVKKCSGGGVSDIPIGVGYTFAGLCEDIIEYPVFQNTIILAKQDEGDTSITVTSSEGLPTSIDVSMSFTLDEGKVPTIYKKYRMDIEHIKTTFLRQTIREVLQESFAKYTAQELYSDKRETVRAEAQGILVKKLGPDGFNVTQFTINETRVPATVTQAISAKVEMIQQAQAAEQAVRKSKAIADQRIAAAKGEAESTQIKADAEAYANDKITKSLSGQLVEYMKAQKWDGKLPQVSGGAVPFINLK